MTSSAKSQDQWNPDVYAAPFGFDRQFLGAVSPSHWLKSLCQQKGTDLGSDHDYVSRDRPSRGEGAWIFVVDTGFNTNHEELVAGHRTIKTYVPPNAFTLDPVSKTMYNQGWRMADQVIDDFVPGLPSSGHGTGVAGVAGGSTYGVASGANLYLMKMSSFYVNKNLQQAKNARITPAASSNVFQKIYDAVTKGGIDPTKSVINLSWGLDRIDPEMAALYTDWFDKFDNLGMVIVIAAGNYGYDACTGKPSKFLDELLPQSLINDASPVIVVGGTYHDGSLWPGSTPGRGSNVASIYAQAIDVRVPVATSNDGYHWQVGTSFAAPQVAGLAAYMLAFPWPAKLNPFDPNVDFYGPSIGRRMKTMLAEKYAYQRLPRDELTNEAMRYLTYDNPTRTLPYDLPHRINVAYNMAFGDQKCKIVVDIPVDIKVYEILAQYRESGAVAEALEIGDSGDGVAIDALVRDSRAYFHAGYVNWYSASKQ